MRTQQRRRTVVVLLVLLVAALVAAVITPAVARAAAAVRVVLDLSGGPVGSTVTARGSGFTPGETVDLRYDNSNDHVWASGTAGAKGGVIVTFVVPYSTPGIHQVWLSGQTGNRTAGTAFAVRESWTQVGGNAGHGSGALYTPRVDRLAVSWSTDLYDPAASGSGAVVDQGAVYATNAHGLVTAVTTNGSSRWYHDLGADVVGSPVVAGDRVILVQRNGVVVALDVLNGRPRWTTSLGGSSSVAAATDRGRAFVGLEDGRLVALDVVTGALIWTARGSGAVTTVPTVAGNAVVVARGTAVSSVQLSDGVARWSTTVGGEPVTGAVAWVPVYNRVLAVSRGVGLVGLDANTGATRYTVSGVRSAFAVTVRGGLVYAEREAPRGVTIEALQGGTGQLNRTVRYVTTPSTGGMTWAGNDSGLLFSTSEDGVLRAVDQRGGAQSQVWSMPVGVATAPIAAVDGALYVVTTDGKLTKFAA